MGSKVIKREAFDRYSLFEKTPKTVFLQPKAVSALRI